MPYDVRIVRARDFVRLDAEGHFDLASTRTLLTDVMWACARSNIGRILLDVRDATANLTAAQLGSLARVSCEVTAPTGDHKIAILTRPDVPFDRATFLASVAQDRGWNIAAFSEFEPAFDWLIA